MKASQITNEMVFNKWKKRIEAGLSPKAMEDFEGWAQVLELPITAQRMASMYRQGLVERHKDFHYYGDDRYRYKINKELL